MTSINTLLENPSWVWFLIFTIIMIVILVFSLLGPTRGEEKHGINLTYRERVINYSLGITLLAVLSYTLGFMRHKVCELSNYKYCKRINSNKGIIIP